MAASGKVTDAVRARIVHWARYGLGRETIADKLRAEGIELTGRTISRVLAAGSPAARGADIAEAVSAELATDTDDADVLAQLRRRHAEVRGLADELAPIAKAGGQNARVYALLVRLEGDLAARIRELEPPPAPDPATDPANVQAKALLIATIEGLLEREPNAAEVRQ